MARYNIPLSYGLYNIFQRYWGGQGDPLYAVLSRRGHSVDWVDVEMSKAELDRLHDVAEEIIDSGEAQEKRVAEQFLRSSKREGYYRNFKVGTSANRLASRWVREAGRGSTGGYVEESMMGAVDKLGLAIGGLDYRFSRDGSRGMGGEDLHTREEKKVMGEAQHKLEKAKRLVQEAYRDLMPIDLRYTGKYRTP